MKPYSILAEHRATVRQIVERHHARNARVLGSVLQGEDTEESDLDILVDPTEETTLFDLGAIQTELVELLGVEVDLLTPGSLPDRWKDRVLSEARTI